MSYSESIRLNEYATTGIKVAAKLLSTKFSYNARPLQALKTLQAPDKFCPFKKTVDCVGDFPYRSLDGSCNNLNSTWWGKSGTPFKRWLPADYGDQFKLNEPRIAKDGRFKIISCVVLKFKALESPIEFQFSSNFIQFFKNLIFLDIYFFKINIG